MSKRARLSKKMGRMKYTTVSVSDSWSRRINPSTFVMYFKYLLRKDPNITRVEIKKRAKRLKIEIAKRRDSARRLAIAKLSGKTIIRDDKDHGGNWTGK